MNAISGHRGLQLSRNDPAWNAGYGSPSRDSPGHCGYPMQDW